MAWFNRHHPCTASAARVNPPQPSRSLPRWSALPLGPWPWWYALAGVAATLAGLYALVLLGPGLGMAGSLVAQFLLFMLVALAVPWAIGRRATVADWGWMPARPGRAALMVGVLTLALTLLVAVVEALHPGAAQASSTVFRGFGLGRDAAVDAAMVLSIVALAPLGEELLFRGLIYRSLRDGLARWLPVGLAMATGAAVSALLFGWAHGAEGQEQQLWQLAGIGLLMVLAYELTGSIAAPVMVHSLNNSLALVAGLQRHPDIRLAAGWIDALAMAGPLLALLLLGLLALLHRRLPRSLPAGRL